LLKAVYAAMASAAVYKVSTGRGVTTGFISDGFVPSVPLLLLTVIINKALITYLDIFILVVFA
jgi:hypothetical protein